MGYTAVVLNDMAGLKQIECLALTFHDIFYELSGILYPWVLAVTFENCQNYTYFW